MLSGAINFPKYDSLLQVRAQKNNRPLWIKSLSIYMINLVEYIGEKKTSRETCIFRRKKYIKKQWFWITAYEYSFLLCAPVLGVIKRKLLFSHGMTR